MKIVIETKGIPSSSSEVTDATRDISEIGAAIAQMEIVKHKLLKYAKGM